VHIILNTYDSSNSKVDAHSGLGMSWINSGDEKTCPAATINHYSHAWSDATDCK